MVVVSAFNHTKPRRCWMSMTRLDCAILHGHLYIVVILSVILLQFHSFHSAMCIYICSAHMPSGACYRTFGMVLSSYETDVVFNKDHELSILQIASEHIVHSCYQGIQKQCNFPHIVLIESTLICSGYRITQ